MPASFNSSFFFDKFDLCARALQTFPQKPRQGSGVLLVDFLGNFCLVGGLKLRLYEQKKLFLRLKNKPYIA